MSVQSSLHLMHSVREDAPEQPEESPPPISPSYIPMLSLPSEVIAAILQNTDSRKDLKHVRQSCKGLASIAIPILFKEVTVVPHRDSFEQLLELSEHTLLSKHVKSLVYDSLRLAKGEDVEWEIDADPLQKLSWNTPAKHSRLQSFLKYHNEHTFKTVEQTWQEMEYLVRIFKVLPRLRAVKVRTANCMGRENISLPYFYERMIKEMGGLQDILFMGQGKATQRARAVLLCSCLTDLKLEHLGLENLIWEELLFFSAYWAISRYIEKLSRALSAPLLATLADKPISYLNLNWEQTCTKSFGGMLSLKSLDLLIDQSQRNLEWGKPRSEPCRFDLLPRILPRLHTLRLTCFDAFADALVDYVLEFSASLKSLTIEDANLFKKDLSKNCYPARDGYWSRDCRENLAFIQRLQQGLKLKNASLQGRLWVPGSWYWDVSAIKQAEMEAEGRPSLKSKIEDYLVHGGKSPLDDVAVVGDPSFILRFVRYAQDYE